MFLSFGHFSALSASCFYKKKGSYNRNTVEFFAWSVEANYTCKISCQTETHNLTFSFSACSTSLGAAVGGRLPDSSFSASSFYNSGHAAKDGRLNKGPYAWCPKYPTLANNDYLQVPTTRRDFSIRIN